MKILTIEAASVLLNGDLLNTFIGNLPSRLHFNGGRYSIPPDSGKKTALSRLFAYLLFKNTPICLYISGWGVWGSCENLDLFYGYRHSFAESRTLMEAPVHIFDQSDEDAFVSILCMVLYFMWDAWVFDVKGNILIRISHDEWFEVKTEDDVVGKMVATELKEYGTVLLSR